MTTPSEPTPGGQAATPSSPVDLAGAQAVNQAVNQALDQADPQSGFLSQDPDLRAALHHSLRREPVGAEEQARLKSLHSRWMQDWARHTGQFPAVPDGVMPASVSTAPSLRPRPATLGHRPARRRVATGGLAGWFGVGGASKAPRWLGGVGVAAALIAGTLLWQHHQNEALLDELSQVDVLSQMAAGVM